MKFMSTMEHLLHVNKHGMTSCQLCVFFGHITIAKENERIDIVVIFLFTYFVGVYIVIVRRANDPYQVHRFT
jgi:hypothetical protein